MSGRIVVPLDGTDAVVLLPPTPDQYLHRLSIDLFEASRPPLQNIESDNFQLDSFDGARQHSVSKLRVWLPRLLP